MDNMFFFLLLNEMFFFPFFSRDSFLSYIKIQAVKRKKNKLLGPKYQNRAFILEIRER